VNYKEVLLESYLGLACEVNILSTIGNELHKSSSHFCELIKKLYEIGKYFIFGKKTKY
jgi:hypothetical protein